MNERKAKSFVVVFAALLLAAAASAQNGRVSWWTFDAGFASPRGGNAQAISAVGQGFVAPAGSRDARVYPGFLANPLLTGTTAVPGSGGGIPLAFSLSQNFPNPFNPATTIVFGVPVASEVTVRVYDLLGREVSVLVSGRKDAGLYETRFDASALSSGVFFCRLQARVLGDGQARSPGAAAGRAGDFTSVRKMILMR